MEEERRIRILTLVRLAQQLAGEAESLVGGAPATLEGVAGLFYDLQRVEVELGRVLTLPVLRGGAT
jgi:hypothetical protein